MKKRIAILAGLILILVCLMACTAAADAPNLGTTGWTELEGKQYYGDKNGDAVTGKCIIDDEYYVFDSDGVLQTGWIQVDGEDTWWTCYENGAIKYYTSGWVDPGWRYTDGTGKIVRSLKNYKSLRIPAKVDAIPDGFFAGVTRDFIVECDPGSAAEKTALLLGLPYDNGKQKVIGTSITNADDKADWIIKNYTTSGMSDREKAKRLHNWLIYNAHYDYTYTEHSENGVLVKGYGVCDSYSRAYMLLLTKAGIENKRLTGDVRSEGHAWNLVKIDGQWYHVDCTWDDPNDSGESSVSGWECYDYFLVGDEFVKKSRTFDEDVSADSNFVRWVTMGDEKYYYGPDGKRLTGWQKIDEEESVYNFEKNTWETQTVTNQYYFSGTGVCQTGLQTIDGATYYLGTNGIMQTGWQRIGENRYYFGADGKAAVGWLPLAGTQDVYNNEKGAWEKVPVTNWYYFSAEGVCQTGLQTIDGALYYFEAHEVFDTYGVMQTGWQTISDSRYYFGTDGKAVTGWQKIDDSTYYFDNYKEVTGLQKIEGNLYYFTSYSGMKTGWLTVGEDRYYFGADGKAAVGWLSLDVTKDVYNYGTGTWEKVSVTNWYYFSTEGICQTGLQAIGGAIYYLGDDGVMRTGWQTVDGKTYCFNENGAALTGMQTIDGNVHCFGADGAAMTGWFMAEDKNVFYFGANGKRVSGDVEIDGALYRFDGNGALTGRVVKEGIYSPEQVLQVKAETGSDGKIHVTTTETVLSISLGYSGWNTFGGVKYYGDENGNALVGPATIDGKSYCFDEQGRMITGWTKVADQWYCASSTGELYHNVWQQVDGTWYYFGADGAMATGWAKIGGEWYYFLDSGKMATGWAKDGGKWYFLSENGALTTGWIRSGADWYLLRPGDGEMVTGWYKDGGSWYYLNDSGRMATGWKEIGKTWYWFGTSGAMKTGWEEIGGSWYWFDDNGAMATGWVKVGGAWYWFNSSGAMVTGWTEIKGNWYYFRDSGAMKTGWFEDKKAEAQLPQNQKRAIWYWFDNGGVMATGWKEIDGQWEMFAENGEWLYTWQGE